MAYRNDDYEDRELTPSPTQRIEDAEMRILTHYSKSKNNKNKVKRYRNNLSDFAKAVLTSKYKEQDGQEISVAEKVVMGTIASLIANPNMRDLKDLQKLVGEDGASDVNISVSVESLLKKVEGNDF